MSRLGETTTLVSPAQVALDSAADVLVFTPCRPVTVFRYGYIVTVELDNTTALQLNLDHRVTAGSDTGRTEKAEIVGSGTQAVGYMSYGDLATPIEVDADEEVVIEVSQAATAGDGKVFLEYQERAFVGSDLGSAVEQTPTEP